MAGTNASFADEQDKTETVIASGVGVDRYKAKQNALRNAVEQAIGFYVSSDTMVDKGQLLKDEILRYNAKYILDSRIVSQEMNEDGLSTARVEVQIAATALKKKLEALLVPVKKEENVSAPPKIYVRQEESAILAGIDRVMAAYPEKAYNFAVGSPEAESKDPATGRTKATIPITVKWDRQFLTDLRQTMRGTARNELTGVEIASFKEGANKRIAKEKRVVCFSERHPYRGAKAEACFAFDKDDGGGKKEPEAGTRGPWPSSFLLSLMAKKIITVSAYFKDKTGKLVESVNYEFVNKDADSSKKQPPTESSPKAGLLLRSGSFTPPNILWQDTETGVIYILTEEAFGLSANVDMDTNMKDITNIEAGMSNATGKE